MIKTYNDFLNELNSSNYDKSTILYLENKITFDEWNMEFNKLNESKIGDFIKSKILPVLKTIKDKLKDAGVKGIKILKKVFKSVMKFFSKYPALRVLLVFIIIMLVIGIVSASAATGTDPNTLIPDPDTLNASIQLITDITSDAMKESDFEKANWLLETKKYLIDLKDGQIDNEWSENVKNLAKMTFNQIKNIKSENQELFNKLAEEGSEIVQKSIKTTKGDTIY